MTTPTRETRSKCTNKPLTMNDMKALIDSAKREIVSSLSAEIMKVAESLEVLNVRVDKLERRIDMVESLDSSNKREINEIRKEISNRPCDLDMNIADTMCFEVQQRLLRKDNVIIFGAPEAVSGSVAERTEKDTVFVKDICKTLDIENPVFHNILRVGKAVNGRPRLLKVTCDELTKRELLKKAKNLKRSNRFRKVFINVDRTRMQQAQFKLKREVEHKKQDDNPDPSPSSHQSPNF